MVVVDDVNENPYTSDYDVSVNGVLVYRPPGSRAYNLSCTESGPRPIARLGLKDPPTSRVHGTALDTSVEILHSSRPPRVAGKNASRHRLTIQSGFRAGRVVITHGTALAGVATRVWLMALR